MRIFAGISRRVNLCPYEAYEFGGSGEESRGVAQTCSRRVYIGGSATFSSSLTRMYCLSGEGQPFGGLIPMDTERRDLLTSRNVARSLRIVDRSPQSTSDAIWKVHVTKLGLREMDKESSRNSHGRGRISRCRTFNVASPQIRGEARTCLVALYDARGSAGKLPNVGVPRKEKGTRSRRCGVGGNPTIPQCTAKSASRGQYGWWPESGFA